MKEGVPEDFEEWGAMIITDTFNISLETLKLLIAFLLDE